MTTTPVVQYLYDLPDTPTTETLNGFIFNATIIPPNYTLTSSATLNRALFSHNNFTLECLLKGAGQPSLSNTVVTAGNIS